ncbi:hypothetical protein Lfu02_42850 [Longispora fulva]|uniref:YcxB-like protein domain-containing protein n=1 Tax=Longispora fulva TaxID=619741 RepID=A0A8J7GAD3_9ACTN|nr:YcxB family protein [Longispora fulva]MBG6136743.1 hypothetical protein [Longispora fulva]GIG59913.1 hypothetical protein Lfu02_42850 [Longispora fulva]
MRIEFTTSRSAGYFRAMLAGGALRSARPYTVAAMILIVLGLLGLAAFEGVGVGGFLDWAAFVVAIGLLCWARWRFLVAVRVPASWRVPRRYVIDGDGLWSGTDQASTRWGWHLVGRVEEVPEAYVFYQDDSAMFDVPREPLSVEQDARLRAFLTDRGLVVRPA